MKSLEFLRIIGGLPHQVESLANLYLLSLLLGLPESVFAGKFNSCFHGTRKCAKFCLSALRISSSRNVTRVVCRKSDSIFGGSSPKILLLRRAPAVLFAPSKNGWGLRMNGIFLCTFSVPMNFASTIRWCPFRAGARAARSAFFVCTRFSFRIFCETNAIFVFARRLYKKALDCEACQTSAKVFAKNDFH